MPSTPNYAILGAGLAGLTAALRLQQAGARVTVLERDAQVGGRARTDGIEGMEGVRIDPAAQLLASMYRRSLALVREVGLAPELVRGSGRDALWRSGRAHEVVYGSVSSMITSGALSIRTKLRLGATYVPYLTRHREDLDLSAPERVAEAGFDQESIASWGRRELGEEFVEYLVQPQLASYYGTVPEQTSAGFYHILAGHGMDVSLHALRGGMGRLADALADRIRAGGGEVQLKEPVSRVRPGPESVSLQLSGDERTFDAAVIAVPAPQAAALIAGLSAERRWLLEQVRYAPMLTVAFVLDGKVGPRYFGLTVPRKEDSGPVAAVCVQENKAPGLVPEGRGLMLAYAAPHTVTELLELEPRQILDRLLPHLDRLIPGTASRVVRARVYRWRDGNPVVYPGYPARLEALRTALAPEHPRLQLAGDYLFSPTIEGAVASGELAARSLCERVAAGI